MEQKLVNDAVAKASEDLPEPESPVSTTSLFLGRFSVTFLRLCSRAPRIVTWRFPVDLRREVMVPPGHFLLVRADHPFRAVIVENRTVLAC